MRILLFFPGARRPLLRPSTVMVGAGRPAPAAALSDGCDGLPLHRSLQVHRARPRAGVERLVQRTEDGADARPAVLPHLPALPPGGGNRARLPDAVDRRDAAGARHAPLHRAMAVRPMAA